MRLPLRAGPPWVNVLARNFTGTYHWVNQPPTPAPLRVVDLALAVISVGKPDVRAVVGPMMWPWRLYEMRSLYWMVQSYVTPVRSWLGLSPLFTTQDAMDPSEKVGPAYRLGMGFAKWAAQITMGIIWPQHLLPLLRAGVAQIQAGSSQQGDMVGLDLQNNWHAIEVKARSGANASFRSRDVIAAKQQASHIARIAGQVPATQFAVLATMRPTRCRVVLDDPVGNHRGPIEVQIDHAAFLKAYYETIYRLDRVRPLRRVTVSDLPGSPEFRVFSLDTFEFGVRADLYEVLHVPDSERMVSELLHIASKWGYATDVPHDISVAPDGYLLRGGRADR